MTSFPADPWAHSREQNPALDMVEFWNDIAERVGSSLLVSQETALTLRPRLRITHEHLG
jgi:hypothetical protein